MSLAYDLVVSAVILMVSLIVSYMAGELFAPGTILHQTASNAVHLNGATRADQWYQILRMWVPMGGVLVAFAWPLIRAYRRQAVTAAQRI